MLASLLPFCTVILIGVRIFAGLPVPPDANAALTALRLRLAAPSDGLRWSSPEQWHITLQFFGELSEERVTFLRQQLRQVRASPAKIHLDALGTFPSKGIFYISAASSEGLTELQAEVQQTLCAEAIAPDSLPFRPHITLARSRGRVSPKASSWLRSPSLPLVGPEIRWLAEEVHLYESLLEKGGARYRVLARQRLNGRG